jgi:hypothetical protein
MVYCIYDLMDGMSTYHPDSTTLPKLGELTTYSKGWQRFFDEKEIRMLCWFHSLIDNFSTLEMQFLTHAASKNINP